MKNQRGTKSAFARDILGRDESYVCKRLKKANFPVDEDGTIDFQEAKAWWDATIQTKHAPRRFRKDHGQGYDARSVHSREPENRLHDETGFNPPEVEFWLKVVEHSYPYMADQFGRVGIKPAKVWELLGTAFFLETCAVMRILGCPEDASLDDVVAYTPFTNKLREWPRSKELERWLVNELKKDEGEPFDPLPRN